MDRRDLPEWITLLLFGVALVAVFSWGLRHLPLRAWIVALEALLRS